MSLLLLFIIYLYHLVYYFLVYLTFNHIKMWKCIFSFGVGRWGIVLNQKITLFHHFYNPLFSDYCNNDAFFCFCFLIKNTWLLKVMIVILLVLFVKKSFVKILLWLLIIIFVE